MRSASVLGMRDFRARTLGSRAQNGDQQVLTHCDLCPLTVTLEHSGSGTVGRLTKHGADHFLGNQTRTLMAGGRME